VWFCTIRDISLEKAFTTVAMEAFKSHPDVPDHSTVVSGFPAHWFDREFRTARRHSALAHTIPALRYCSRIVRRRRLSLHARGQHWQESKYAAIIDSARSFDGAHWVDADTVTIRTSAMIAKDGHFPESQTNERTNV
jgi:hypothetical protein